MDDKKNHTPRSFWTSQMDAGQNFMETVTHYPVDECCERMVSIRDTVSDADVDVVFSETQILPGVDRVFFLREGLISGFIAAAREMNGRGWTMKVEDAFRSRSMQKGLALKRGLFDAVLKRLIWEFDGTVPSERFIRDRLGALIARCPKTGTHMSGSAIDISVLHSENGTEVDRGAPYLELSELTPMDSPFAGEECLRNRMVITGIMAAHGFAAYPYEFWHYSSGDAIAELLAGKDGSGRYGPVDLDTASGNVTAIVNPNAELNSNEEISIGIKDALGRLSV